MHGPIRLLKSNKLTDFKVLGPMYEWAEDDSYLITNRVNFKGTPGVVLTYYNPPVHQIGNPELDAYHEGLDKVISSKGEFEFLILYGANDPAHAGGDLKESLIRLDKTLSIKREKENEGRPADEIDRYFEWADLRIKKGVALLAGVRRAAEHMRVVGVCGGGTRFGGSAEVPLMADYVVGDSRSALCFSETMIGLLPGWGAAARSMIKAGLENTRYMIETAKAVTADLATKTGLYNTVVQVPFSFPRRERTPDRDGDRIRYLEKLDIHNDETGGLLLPTAFEIATCPEEDIPCVDPDERLILATEKETRDEVLRRSTPATYSHIWGKPLNEVRGEIEKLGKPLAPQSIEALSRIFSGVDPENLDETALINEAAEADARLYRDPRFRAGIVATLEQRVADFREL